MNTRFVGWAVSAHASLTSKARNAWATSCPPYGTHDGRSLEKRSASRQIDTSPFAPIIPGRASLLWAAVMRYVTAILLSSLFGASYAAPTWLFEASGAIAGPISRYSSNERTIAFTGKNIDGVPSFTSFIANTELTTGSNGFALQLSTRKTPRFLTPGTYPLAEQAPFKSNGHPGLDVAIEGNGCSGLYGEFAIQRYELNASSRPVYVDVSFKFLCGENQTETTVGRFVYDALGGPISFAEPQPNVSVPTVSDTSIVAMSFLLLLLGVGALRKVTTTRDALPHRISPQRTHGRHQFGCGEPHPTRKTK